MAGDLSRGVYSDDRKNGAEWLLTLRLPGQDAIAGDIVFERILLQIFKKCDNREAKTLGGPGFLGPRMSENIISPACS